MTEPSEYELAAWLDIQRFQGRPLSRAMRGAGEQLAVGVEKLGARAVKELQNHPRAQDLVVKGQDVAGKGAKAVGKGARKAVAVVPDGLVDWAGTAAESARKAVARISRVGLSPKQVVARHRKLGHNVGKLSDVRRLDLEQVDAVRGRGATWYYPAAGALSGAGAGLLVAGGELVIPVTGGAAAAPGGAVVAGAVLGDTAVVLGLASRSVGHIAMLYGYDPEEPGEKLFVMSVVNAGTAMSASAKNAAMADISRLTQALVRGKTWALLDKSIITQVSKKFAERFSIRFTKQSLGKVVPVAGILIGSTLNWTTLESIVDAAGIAYRQRFLIEKYPHLADEGGLHPATDSGPDSPDAVDEEISVIDEIAEAGGPDLR